MTRSSARASLQDAIVVALLTAIAFVPLASSFAGVGWLVLAVIAVSVGILIAERSSALNWPGTVPVVLVFAAYVLLAGPAPSLNQDLAIMLPTGKGMATVFANTVNCWGILIGTLPRIDSAGPVMLVPLILGLFPPALAMGLARLTRSAAMPVLPLAFMLAATLALGRGEASRQILTGIAFSVLALGWVSMRGRRHDTAPVRRSPRQVMAAVVVLGMAATLAPLLAGRVAGEVAPLKLRETVARGFDTTSVVTPLQTFRRFAAAPPDDRDNVHDRALLHVVGKVRGKRLRFAVLDWYDGEQWRPNPDRSPANSMARYLRLSSTIDNPAPGPLVSVEVGVRRAWRLNWVPTIGALQSFEFTHIQSSSRRDDLVYNPETSTALLPMTLRGVDDYAFTAKVPDDRLDPTMRAAQGVDEELFARASYLDTLARDYRARTQTPMQALFAAAKGLKRQGRYSDGVTAWEAARYPAGHDLARMDQQFVHAAQMVGNDEQYAATMALMAIRLGIPARVVVGARVPPRGTIRGRDVHAWVEVQVADRSWRTLPTEKFMGHKPPQRKMRGKPRPDFSAWQPPPAPRPPQSQQPQDDKPKIKKKPRPQPTDEGGGFLGWLLGLVLLVAAIPGAKALRRRRRRRRDRGSSRVAGAWDELVDQSRDLGADWAPGLTRPEEASRLGIDVDLAERVDSLVFASAQPADPEVSQVWSRVKVRRGQLRRGTVWWRRVLAPFNPITLLRRRPRV